MSDELEKLKASLAQFGLVRQSPAGRLLGTRWQAHRDHAEKIVPRDVLRDAVTAAKQYCPAILRLANAFQYNTSDQSFSFDYSPDFDFADEPMLAASFNVHRDGFHQFVPVSEDPIIWMHKWLWVADDYKEFDVFRSMRRSLALCQVMPVEEQRRFHRRAAWLEKLNGFRG